jgi:hypothetical protein
MKKKTNLGFSGSKFWGVIHYSGGTPTPRVPHSTLSWGERGEFLVGLIYHKQVSIILTHCIRWYSFIYSYSYVLDHFITRLTNLIVGTTSASFGSIDHPRAETQCDQPSRPVDTLVSPWCRLRGPLTSQDVISVGTAILANCTTPLSWWASLAPLSHPSPLSLTWKFSTWSSPNIHQVEPASS